MGGGVAAFGASAIVSSTAFADGGSQPSCRPMPTATSTLTGNHIDSKKDWILVTPSSATFSPATCPCGGTSEVQYRWELTSTAAGVALYLTGSGGSPLDSSFSAASPDAVTVPQVYIRRSAGGNLVAATYFPRLTVRFVCTSGGSTDWSCRAFSAAITWTNGGGPHGTITSQTPSTIGPPDNSSSCDSPAP